MANELLPLPTDYETLTTAGIDGEGTPLADLVGETLWVYALERYKAYDKVGYRLYCRIQTGNALAPQMRQVRTQAPQPCRVFGIVMGNTEESNKRLEKPWRLEVVQDGKSILVK